MLSEKTVLDPDDVGHYPIGGLADVAEPPVQHHIVTARDGQPVFVSHVGRRGFHELEQALTTRGDVRAVLDVVRRPKPLCGRVITPVEQRVKCFQDERPVPILLLLSP